MKQIFLIFSFLIYFINCHKIKVNSSDYNIYTSKKTVEHLDNILCQCHPNCKTCMDSYNESNMNCILCKEGFYKLNGTNNCYKTLNNNFYFKENIFYPCDENCLTCSDGKNNISNNCLSCDNL